MSLAMICIHISNVLQVFGPLCVPQVTYWPLIGVRAPKLRRVYARRVSGMPTRDSVYSYPCIKGATRELFGLTIPLLPYPHHLRPLSPISTPIHP